MQTNLNLFTEDPGLPLTRPLAFIDLETTGTNIASDRIVELSILKLSPGGKKDIVTRRVNPTIPIPPEASAVHGITDEHVKDLPGFKEIARELTLFLEGCDLGGYNSTRFDIPLLVEEFMRAEVEFDIRNRKLVDVQIIFHRMEQRTLSAAYKFYCNKELKDAHSAEADIVATYEVLLSQLQRYGNLQKDIGYLHEFCNLNNFADLAGRIAYNSKGVEVFNFGKHKDKPVEEIFKTEPSYYEWIMKGDFPLYTKKVVTAIRLRAIQTKEK